MNNFIALVLIVFAGLLSGSYALPTKYVTKWRFENIWFLYSVWALFILPWVTILFFAPQVFAIYHATPLSLLLVLSLGGIGFGIGQVCFALALAKIGLGLGFVINIGIGMSLGFLLPLIFEHPEQILTPFGLITLTGLLFALSGLYISNYAGMLRVKDKYIQSSLEKNPEYKSTHLFGLLFAVLSGLSVAEQNFILALTMPIQKIAIDLGASKFGAANIIWPIFLSFSFLPYATYMLFLHYKNKSAVLYKKDFMKHTLLGISMAVFGLSAVFLYCKASQLIGELGPLIGWPIFMVLIILTSNFWGFRHKEWMDASKKTISVLKVGLLFLIVAVFVLGVGSYLKT